MEDPDEYQSAVWADSRRPAPDRGRGRRLAEVAGAQVIAAEVDERWHRLGADGRVPQLLRNGQRGWKRQPVGGLTGLGTSPFRMIRWSAAARGPGSGSPTSAPSVYGCSLVAEQLAPVGDFRDAAQVHHRDSVADVLDHAHVVGHEQVGQARARAGAA